MDYLDITLRKLIGILEYKQKLLKQIYKAKESAVYMRKRNGKVSFYELNNGKTSGITNKCERVLYLARNTKIKEELFVLSLNRKILQSAVSRIRKTDIKRIDRILDNFNIGEKNYEYLDWQWMNAEYEKNSFKKEELKYTTLGGLKVRSKSELLIASCLEKQGIPFRYEAKFVVAGRVIYPDFTIKCPDGTIVIWEHFGLMNNEDYYSRTMEKIELYRQEGFVQYKNLICTREDDVRNAKNIDFIIERFILM